MPYLRPDPELETAASHLAPYARRCLEGAAEGALRVHAEALGLAHLIGHLMRDEDCAAHRMVVHAFADPPTIAGEILALSTGIMVVGSDRALPFSPLGLETLEDARREAVRSGAGSIGATHLLRSAAAHLDPDLRADLEQAGFRPARADADGAGEAPDTEGGGSARVAPGGSLFRHFSGEAKRMMGLACRLADRAGRSAIAPAHILLAALEIEPALQEHTGLSLMRARAQCSGRDEDREPLKTREIAAEEDLVGFLASLPAGADTLGILGGCLGDRTAEIRQLLARHRITPEAVDRGRGAFRDPDCPPSPR